MPGRGGYRGYVNQWIDITCPECNTVCGQLKLDPGPAGRDPATWFMRVRKPTGEWPQNGLLFRRRSVNVFGETDERAIEWIHSAKNCGCRR